MKKLSNMRTMVTFVRCAETGSITAAARQLGISPQAASRHIIELERWVGASLFTRTTRKLALTQEGAMFFRRCSESLRNIDDGVRALRRTSQDLAGTVRLGVTPFAIARTLVAPLLGPFQERYPEISLDVVAQNENPDIVAQEIDVGVLAGALPEALEGAQRIADLPLVLCAAPSYLARHGMPRGPEDFARHRWIAIRNARDSNREVPFRFRRGQRVVVEHVPVTLASNDAATALRALLDGAGIGQVPWFRASSHVRAGRLTPLDLGFEPDVIGLYVYLSRQSRAPRRSQALADYLSEHLSERAASAA
jgi:DNA-binding transcriptional LysR family regulator